MLLSKRRKVAAMHQLQGLFQTAICNTTGLSPTLVKRWVKIPYDSPDHATAGPLPPVANSKKVPPRGPCRKVSLVFRETRKKRRVFESDIKLLDAFVILAGMKVNQKIE